MIAPDSNIDTSPSMRLGNFPEGVSWAKSFSRGDFEGLGLYRIGNITQFFEQPDDPCRTGSGGMKYFEHGILLKTRAYPLGICVMVDVPAAASHTLSSKAQTAALHVHSEPQTNRG